MGKAQSSAAVLTAITFKIQLQQSKLTSNTPNPDDQQGIYQYSEYFWTLSTLVECVWGWSATSADVLFSCKCRLKPGGSKWDELGGSYQDTLGGSYWNTLGGSQLISTDATAPCQPPSHDSNYSGLKSAPNSFLLLHPASLILNETQAYLKCSQLKDAFERIPIEHASTGILICMYGSAPGMFNSASFLDIKYPRLTQSNTQLYTTQLYSLSGKVI